MNNTLKQLQEKALHTAKLVPQSQRDLFISEIETITTLAFEAGKAEAIAKCEKAFNDVSDSFLLDSKVNIEQGKQILNKKMFWIMINELLQAKE